MRRHVTAILSFLAVCGCSSPSRNGTSQQQNTEFAVPLFAVPEAFPSIFAEALPAKFRVALLQSVQFRQIHRRWPNNLAELSAFFELSSEDPVYSVRIEVNTDDSLSIGWITDTGALLPAVAVVTKEYRVTYDILAAAEAAKAARQQIINHRNERLGAARAVEEVLKAIH